MRFNVVYALRFIAIYALLALLFSFTTWGQSCCDSTGPLHDEGILELAFHAIGHVVFGAIAAIPTRRLWLIATAGLVALALDFDHVPAWLGAPTIARAAHSIAFLLIAATAMGLLARRGWFGPVSGWLAAAIAAAGVITHISFDAVLGLGIMPLWAPFSDNEVQFGRISGALLLGAGTALVLGAALWERRAVGAPPRP